MKMHKPGCQCQHHRSKGTLLKKYINAKSGRPKTMPQQFGTEMLAAFQLLNSTGNASQIWRHLERAHIVCQSSAWRHFAIHSIMLCFAFMSRDWKEFLGQVPKTILAVPQSLLGFTAAGNTGRSSVGAFEKMPVPPDLAHFVAR